MEVPTAQPSRCPVCDCPYESVSQHDRGVMVNLLDNPRYQRVCFEPETIDDVPQLLFFHHNHKQLNTSQGSERPTLGETAIHKPNSPPSH